MISAETAASALEQLQGILRQQRLLEDVPDKDRLLATSGDTGERQLLSWLRSSRPHLRHGPVSTTRTCRFNVPLWGEPGEWEPEGERVQQSRAMLSEEVHWLTEHLEGTAIILQTEPWGHDLLVSLGTGQGQSAQISVQLPRIYPSARICLRSISGADSVIHDIHRGYLPVFAPISLTAIVRIVRHAIGSGSATER